MLILTNPHSQSNGVEINIFEKQLHKASIVRLKSILGDEVRSICLYIQSWTGSGLSICNLTGEVNSR